MPAALASKTLGLPVAIIKSLVDAGVLRETTNPGGLAPGSYYLKHSVEGLLDELSSRAAPIQSRTDLIALRRAALLAGSPWKNPWPGILKGVLEGQLDLFSRGSGQAPLGGYCIAEDDISSISAKALPWPEPESFPPLTRADIGFLLDVPTPSVYALIQDGILSPRPTLQEVQMFHHEFVMSSEAARLLSGREDLAGCDASSSLSRSGLEPVYTTTYKMRRVWRRSDVLRHARMVLGGDGSNHLRAADS